MKEKLILFVIVISTLLACGGSKKRRPHDRRTVGVALGGGGAKAAAEVGVLKVIEKAGIKVGYVSGSSMGALIGGLYAAGYTANEIDSLLMTEEWLSIFDKNKIKWSFESSERTIFGLIKGDSLEEYLGRALEKKGCTSIKDTKKKNKIKFSCTATRIINREKLEEVILDSGDMAKAIRASMAYPAPIVGYKPVEWNGDSLVDGGMLNNLPVDLVRKLGAKKVIAIDVESPEETKLTLRKICDLTRVKLDILQKKIWDLTGVKLDEIPLPKKIKKIVDRTKNVTLTIEEYLENHLIEYLKEYSVKTLNTIEGFLDEPVIKLLLPEDIKNVIRIKWLVDWLADHHESKEKRKKNFESADVKIWIDLTDNNILDYNISDMRKMIDKGDSVAKTDHWESLEKLSSNKRKK